MNTEILSRYHLFMNGVQIGKLGFETVERAEAASQELRTIFANTGKRVTARVVPDPEFDFVWRVMMNNVIVESLSFGDKDEATGTALAITAVFK